MRHHREDHFLLSVGIHTLVQLSVVASVMLRILLVFCVRSFQPFPLRDGSFSTLGRLHGIFSHSIPQISLKC